MSIKTILHVFPSYPEKYCTRIKNFCSENLNDYQHEYLAIVSCKDDTDQVRSVSESSENSSLKRFLFLRRELLASNDLVIFHSLNYSGKFLLQLALIMKFTGLGKKSLWMCWGADVYTVNKGNGFRYYLLELLRKTIISRLRFISSVFKDDFEISRLRYNPNALYVELIYPNPMPYIGVEKTSKKIMKNKRISILAGNSADSRNNHLELFEKLKLIKSDIHITCPLSYGDAEYAKKIASIGREMFGDSFEALFEFETPEKYAERMRNIDMAVYYHNRQQGFGVVLQLLHMGKLVSIRQDTTAYHFLKSQKLPVFNSFNIENISPADIWRDDDFESKRIIENKFSDEAILMLWKKNLGRLSSITID